MSTAEAYRTFGDVEAARSSPSYQRLSHAVADDPVTIARLDELPAMKRQPNLLFGACRYHGLPVEDTDAVMPLIRERWDELVATMATHATQTNECARTSALLPILARIEGPIALVEVGTSAGLCLFPDRYRITYDDLPPCGPADSPVHLGVDAGGTVPAPLPTPDVRARIGIDLNPLDVTDDHDLAWLDALIWPEHDERRARLRAAATVARAEPPTVLAGDLVERIDDALALVPDDVTPVVFHTAVLWYLQPARRRAFASRVLAHPRAIWVSNEAPGVVDELTTTMVAPPEARGPAAFLLAVQGREVAGIADPHGTWLRLAPPA